jgi:hypothetical protein
MEVNNRFLRQLDLCPPEKLQFPIVVIGAGAIGSATVLTLAKLGCANITVWDHDILTEHNLPNQMCKPAMLGRSKVEALRELVKELTDVELRTEASRYRGQRLQGVVIASVDKMDVRIELWGRIKLRVEVPLLIDPRMGAEIGRIYSIRPTDATACRVYEENLYPSSQAEQLPCSARSIIYCPAVMAGLIAAQVKAYAMGRPVKREVYLDLPNLLLGAA